MKSERGLTLVELLISITIISLIAGVSAQMVGGAFDSWEHQRGKGYLLNAGRLAMDRMVSGIRTTTWVLLPLMISDPTDPGYPASSYYPRNILAFSYMIDNDGDGLADEDPYYDIVWNNKSGLKGIDDNNDGLIDNGFAGADDDEDGVKNEDPIDGVDNDGDGRIDEDPGSQFYTSVDDDDGDGPWDEDVFDPVIYYLNGTDLRERRDEYNFTISDFVLASNVTEFIVLRRRVNGNTLIDLYLKLDNGTYSVELSTTTVARAMFKP
ncbi:MAG: prepilin-type N-terminal cleavage/methylation domain-containing protein [Nitrospiraceae bacterium]|nr:MAG: prepilin-type N-terminal cleavage/methylation domain-containing protein [Nitrospiraceae bacterium]